MQPPPLPPNLEAMKEAVHELYRPGLRQVGRHKFYKPYPEGINRENPYPRGYRIPEFSLFSGENGHQLWSMWPDSQYIVGISLISNSGDFLTH